MLSWEAILESTDGDVIKVTIYLIVHLLVSVRVRFQGLPFSHGQRQQRIQGPRNPATRDEVRAKGLDELLKGTYGIWLQAIKPSHRHWSQARRKYLTHQSLVFGMDGHPLIKLAYMFYGVRSTIVHCERRLMESPRELSPFYLTCEG